MERTTKSATRAVWSYAIGPKIEPSLEPILLTIWGNLAPAYTGAQFTQKTCVAPTREHHLDPRGALRAQENVLISPLKNISFTGKVALLRQGGALL